ncbi:VOC family protein [Halanaeroarchaeum sulfurireducens]|uniref:Glyoxalase/bleomycin resistance protein/dioxygenase n=1 Tax=Halanaeroarchaeum sulfurireducens TaxID=1604004 RepID=A0A0F7PB46_9EURY|nr:VOC family protein [Halanaeroarchaeum sulfurireducens]AKH97370.1 glyoxalase/bleomycin resistance protein/dioxygenase [Halanaeroarchaeum sulfurireducens]
MTDDEPVTADPPESAMHTTGTDHVTIWGSNAEDTVAFYRDLLGMPLVLRQPNLDDPSQTHLFFDTGDGRMLTFFVSDDRDADTAPQATPTGAVHHLAFRFDPDRFRTVVGALEADGRTYNEFDRGIFHSLYTRDNDGLVVELTTDVYEIPDDRRGEVLATAQRIREGEGAEYAQAEHLRRALEELDLPVVEHDLPDAATGTGMD